MLPRRPSPAQSPPQSTLLKSWPLQLVAIFASAIYFYSLLWWTEPRDMTLFQGPWFNHIVHYGPIGAFSHPFSNYTPPYLYLLAAASLAHNILAPMYAVKLLSVAGTIFAAAAVADLIRATGGKPKYAVLVFILPSVAINAALLAQCDALWAGSCVFAVAAMIRGRTASSLLWCGVAVAFKAQAVFLAPFIIGTLIGRRPPLWHWTIPALTFVALMVPAWLAGWPAWQLAMIYPSQTAWMSFPGRLANPWIVPTMFGWESASNYYWLGFCTAGAAAGTTALLASTSARRPQALLCLALFSALALPYFLPKMLERYFFLADLLSLALAVSSRTRWSLFLAISVQLASSLSLLTYMYFYYWAYPTLAATGLSTAALVISFWLARRSGAQWPRLTWRERPSARVENFAPTVETA